MIRASLIALNLVLTLESSCTSFPSQAGKSRFLLNSLPPILKKRASKLEN